jgi:hypothetical protein
MELKMKNITLKKFADELGYKSVLDARFDIIILENKGVFECAIDVATIDENTQFNIIFNKEKFHEVMQDKQLKYRLACMK